MRGRKRCVDQSVWSFFLHRFNLCCEGNNISARYPVWDGFACQLFTSLPPKLHIPKDERAFCKIPFLEHPPTLSQWRVLDVIHEDFFTNQLMRCFFPIMTSESNR